MHLNSEKKRPQLVEILNQNGTSDNPQKSEVTNLPLSSNQQSVNVTVINNTFNLRPQSGGTYTIQLDNILLLKSDGTFVPVPLNSTFTSMSTSQIDSVLLSYKSAYATLVSSMASATLHYSRFTSASNATSEVYNLKD